MSFTYPKVVTDTAPVTQAFGDSAAVGTATAASREDHKHGMPVDPVVAGRATITASFSTTSTTYTNVTNLTVDITTAATAVMHAGFHSSYVYNDTVSDGIGIALSVGSVIVAEHWLDGTGYAASEKHNGDIISASTSVASGTYTCKLQIAAITGGTAYVYASTGSGAQAEVWVIALQA